MTQLTNYNQTLRGAPKSCETLAWMLSSLALFLFFKAFLADFFYIGKRNVFTYR